VSITAVRLGITGFIIPFFFLYNPVLLFDGESVVASLQALVTASIGVICLASGLQGWLMTKTSIIQRLLLFVTAFLMIDPTLLTDIIGITLLVLLIIWQKITGKKQLSNENPSVRSIV